MVPPRHHRKLATAALLAGLLSGTQAGAQLDPSLDGPRRQDQEAVLALVPNGSATMEATADGPWSDPSTWGGQVPAAGARVLIPEGRTVSYDVSSDAALLSLRIDGTLTFATDQATKLTVDTLVVTHPGHLIVGTAADPVRLAQGAQIIFADVSGGPADPGSLGLGLLAFGRVTLHGEARTAFHRATSMPEVGDSSIDLDVEPFGWQPGDRILIPATRAAEKGGKDELVTLTAVTGTRIEFSPALAEERLSPRPEFTPHVANLTRSIVLRSASTDQAERGHVQLLHRRDVDVRYAAFQDLGRTDRSQDFSASNLPQRYPLYVRSSQPGTERDEPVQLVGNVVEGSKGHGMVLRDLHVAADYNIAHDIFGGGFVVEAGNETGALRWNLAVNMRGLSGPDGGAAKRAHGTEYYAGSGDGFWFQSRLLHNRNNVTANASGAGFIYFHRPTPLSPDSGIHPSTLEHPESANYKSPGHKHNGGIDIDKPAIQGFGNNESYGIDGVGLQVIKNSPTQHHDDRSILEGFRAWNVQNGVSWDYTGHYLMRDFELFASPDSKSKPWTSRGIHIVQNAVDMTFDDMHSEGFVVGFDVHHNSATNKLKFNSLPGSVQTARMRYEGNDTDVDIGGNDPAHHVHLGDAVSALAPSVKLSKDSDLSIGDEASGPGDISLIGERTDSLGVSELLIGTERGIEETVRRHVYEMSLEGLLERGVWENADGSHFALYELLTTDRFTGVRRRYEVPITIRGGKEGDATVLGQLSTTQVDGVPTVNSSAYAQFDRAGTSRDVPVTFDLLENDSDVDGDDFQLVEVGEALHGTVERLDGGNITYSPDPGFDGIDGFQYTIVDASGSGRETQGRVRIDVLAVATAAAAPPTETPTPGGGTQTGGAPGTGGGAGGGASASGGSTATGGAPGGGASASGGSTAPGDDPVASAAVGNGPEAGDQAEAASEAAASDGCGCQTPGSVPGGSLPLVPTLLALGSLLLRRRRS